MESELQSDERKLPEIPANQGIATAPDPNEFIKALFHEISQPVSALWCALEIAASRPPRAEEDRQDRMTSYALVEKLGNRLRELQEQANTLFFSNPDR